MKYQIRTHLIGPLYLRPLWKWSRLPFWRRVYLRLLHQGPEMFL